MIKASLVVILIGLGAITSTSAHAQMQQGYANDKPDVTVDRSVLQDLKGYKPPPMFGGDFMPPTTNRVAPKSRLEEAKKSVEVTSPSQPTPPVARMTTPNAEDLLKHPTENFHVLTERNASAPLTAPVADMDNGDGPLLPLPDDDNDPAAAHAKAIKAKAAKDAVKDVAKKEPKESGVKKADKKKDEPKKEKAVAKKSEPEKKTESAKTETVKIEATKMVKPNPNAYRPKAAQTMPAIPPIKVEKNILPPLSGSPLPSMPPTTNMITPEAQKPSVGLRMMDAALERQMESDAGKIKEQLATTDVKAVKAADKKPAPLAKKTPSAKISDKTLVFAAKEITLSDDIQAQISEQILPEILKDAKSRVQILSFATSPDKTESSARRISLSRALAVRDYLKTKKIEVSRIDVRALASDGNSVPPDKVDIILLK